MSEQKNSDAAGFQSIDLKSIFMLPLTALIEAGSAMALNQTNFMLNQCFTKNGDVYEPIMIKMEQTSIVNIPPVSLDGNSGAAAQTVKTQFNLPILTIIPLNSLAVDQSTISFNLEITGISEKESVNKNEAPEAELLGRFINGSENLNNQDSFKPSLEVNVHTGQLPLPQGVLTIIEAFSKSIVPTQILA
ncbi:hypothetical protein M2347_003176 [Chryseobacterium sp. H1D6B]|uniref:DUF2589 domain-containing protein n=1 Tax=Chryseobacterium sp. H1D6B TaxID=2940588 RepID=UPI0015CECFF5|nr:DUF2589 domain-containing protein [Chryseobacterium sp. H1D6B]MDH6253449.1 hypothetical protein [Chryseobacterium sp. H1D6B]